jgi:hypothetical protein
LPLSARQRRLLHRPLREFPLRQPAPIRRSINSRIKVYSGPGIKPRELGLSFARQRIRTRARLAGILPTADFAAWFSLAHGIILLWWDEIVPFSGGMR